MLLERIIRRSDLSDGKPVRIKRGDVDIVCVKVDEAVYAFRNSCPHTGYKLHLGKVRGCVLTCTSHLARFDLRDGRLVAPPMEGQDIPTPDLPMYPVTLDGDYISVDVGEES